MRVEEFSVSEHGAGDVYEAIGDLSEGSAVAVSPGSHAFALGLADGFALGCDACPVVCGIGEAIVGRESPDDDELVSGASGDGCGAGQAAQCLWISSSQRFVCFCEQGGEDDSSDSGDGVEDAGVGVFGCGAAVGLLDDDGFGHLAGHPLQVLVDVGDRRLTTFSTGIRVSMWLVAASTTPCPTAIGCWRNRASS